MTVEALPRVKDYLGNGVTTVFPVPFQFLNATDLLVKLRTAAGIETVQALGIAYSASGGNGAMGAITFAAAPVVGLTVIVQGDTDRSQPTDYVTGDAFPAESHERALDRHSMALLEQDDDIADIDARALTVLPGQSLASIDKASLVGKFLAGDVDGNLFPSAGTGGGDPALRTDLAQDDGGRLMGLTHEPAAPYISKSALGRFQKTIYVTDDPFGCSPGPVGGGAGPDITNQLRAAIAKGASRIVFPSLSGGQNYYVSETIELPSYVTIEGQNGWSTGIHSSDLDAPIFYADGQEHIIFKHLRLGYTATPSEGAIALFMDKCGHCDYYSIKPNQVWGGLKITGTGATEGNHNVWGLTVQSYEDFGVMVENALDVKLFGMRGKPFARPGLHGGIWLRGGVEKFMCFNAEITQGAHSIVTEGIGGSKARFLSPWYNDFFGGVFDSAAQQCAYLRQATQLSFYGSWFASAGRAADDVNYENLAFMAGLDASECDHLKIIGGDLVSNGGQGALIYGDCRATMIDGVTAKQNGKSGVSDVGHIEFADVGGLPTNFAVKNSHFQRDPDTVTYRCPYSVVAYGTLADDFEISGNKFGGTTYAGPAANGTTRIVDRNRV